MNDVSPKNRKDGLRSGQGGCRTSDEKQQFSGSSMGFGASHRRIQESTAALTGLGRQLLHPPDADRARLDQDRAWGSACQGAIFGKPHGARGEII
jgi:hypothetical protein